MLQREGSNFHQWGIPFAQHLIFKHWIGWFEDSIESNGFYNDRFDLFIVISVNSITCSRDCFNPLLPIL